MSLKISRILHAGYVIESSKAIIAFDTIFQNPFSGNCHAFPEVRFNTEQIKKLQFDAVFISHFHDDHFCMQSLDLISRATPIYMFCVHDELLQLIRCLGFTNVQSLRLNHPVHIKDIAVTPRKSLDEDVDSLFQIQAQGLNILNVVDSWIDYETLDLLKNEKPWDLIMWPFQTMREMEVLSPSRYPESDRLVPPEWIEQINHLNPKYLISSSCQFKMEPWSWYNKAFFPISYASFAEQIQKVNQQIEVRRLDPSESISFENDRWNVSEPLPWVKKDSVEALDYEYDPKVIPTPISEMAKHFPLSNDQLEKALKFCQEDLIEIYNQRSEFAHEYFSSLKVWNLKLYSPHNEYSVFYRFQDGKIVDRIDSCKEFGWVTEISLSKVYSALYEGEALTSLYIRVNDVKFSESIERELSDIDAIEDPLIRCLYDGSLGAYQKAQLKNLNVQF